MPNTPNCVDQSKFTHINDEWIELLTHLVPEHDEQHRPQSLPPTAHQWLWARVIVEISARMGRDLSRQSAEKP